MLVSHLPFIPQEHDVPDGLMEAFPWGDEGGEGSGWLGCQRSAPLRRCACLLWWVWLVCAVLDGVLCVRRAVLGCHRCLWCGGPVVIVLPRCACGDAYGGCYPSC